MVAARKHLLGVMVAGALLTAPLGYIAGQGLVGPASAGTVPDQAARAAAEEAEHQAVEAESTLIEDPEGVNIIPAGKAPEALVADCRAHVARGVQTPEQADQVYACEALLLAEEGKIPPGRYTNAKLEHLVKGQGRDDEPQR